MASALAKSPLASASVDDVGLGGAVLGAGLGVHDLGLGQAAGGRLGLVGLGELHLGQGLFLGGGPLGLGLDEDLVGLELAGQLAGLGFLDFLDLVFFGLGGGGGDLNGLGPLGGHDLFGVLDLLLFFDHGPLDDDAFADDVLDLPFRPRGPSLWRCGRARRYVRVRSARALLALATRSVSTASVRSLARWATRTAAAACSLRRRPALLRWRCGPFRLCNALLLRPSGPRPVRGPGGEGDLAGLLGLGLGLLAFELEDGFAGFDVLLGDGFFFFAGDVVGQHLLAWRSGR